MSIVREIKRRNVFRMAVLYIVAAWLIMQVTEVLITLTNLPHWIGPIIIWLLAIGFPISLIFSWFYEITPGGISLEKDVDPEQSITHVTGRRLDFIVISMLVAAVILFAYDKWWIGGPPEKSIAVMPFTNMSADPEQEYFSDGISEGLSNYLGKVPELMVIAHSSTVSLKGRNLEIPEIGRRLNVAHVLVGSVRKAKNQVRITAQLIEARTNKHLWSETYDRELADIFAIQDEISGQIAQALKIKLGAGKQDAMAHPQNLTENLEAYELYLRGRYFWQRRGEDNIRHAIDLFEQATKLDPQFARAWSSLAAAHNSAPAYSFEPEEEHSAQAVSAAKKALMLDNSLAEAYAALAVISHVNRKWSEAETHYLRAIASEPMNSTAHLWYGEQLHSLGLVRKGIDETLIAYQLDPLHPGTNASLGHMYLSVGDINNALGYGSIASDLGHNLGFFIQARSYLHLGQFDRAIELATQFDAQFDERFDRQLNKPNTPIEKLFIEAKRDAEKRAVFFETHAEYEKELGLFYLPSYVGFGRIDHAYSVVNTKTNPIASNMLWLFWEPEMAAFRQDPRFAELVSKLGLLDYWREYGWPDACQPAGDSLICE